jgi:hypothetical protein
MRLLAIAFSLATLAAAPSSVADLLAFERAMVQAEASIRESAYGAIVLTVALELAWWVPAGYSIDQRVAYYAMLDSVYDWRNCKEATLSLNGSLP